jgi:hypothetical protein
MPQCLASCLFAIAFALSASPAFAAVQRTFVSTAGSDANACSLGAPCRTFAAAIAQTSPSGEIVVLDSGGYGPATINKSVAITAPPGVYAGISVTSAGGTGVTVNGAGIDVALRGLTINATATGTTTGISFAGGSRVAIERCEITGFQFGIWITAVDSATEIADTAVSGSLATGVLVGVGVPNNGMRATLTRVRIENGAADGIIAQEGADVGVFASTIAGNQGAAISATTVTTSPLTRVTVADSMLKSNHHGGIDAAGTASGSGVFVTVDRTTIDHNSFYGVHVAGGAGAVVIATISHTTIFDHSTGVLAENGAIAHVAYSTVVRNAFGLSNNAATFNTNKTSYVFGNSTDVSGTISVQPSQ